MKCSLLRVLPSDKLSDQTDQGNAFGNWDPDKFCVEDSAFGFIRMKNGAVIELESAWALNTLEVDEAKNKPVWYQSRS